MNVTTYVLICINAKLDWEMFHVPKIYHCKENILKYLYWTRKRLPHLGRNRPERSNVCNCNTNIYKIRKLCKTIFSLFYNILQHANCPFIFEFQTSFLPYCKIFYIIYQGLRSVLVGWGGRYCMGAKSQIHPLYFFSIVFICLGQIRLILG